MCRVAGLKCPRYDSRYHVVLKLQHQRACNVLGVTDHNSSAVVQKCVSHTLLVGVEFLEVPNGGEGIAVPIIRPVLGLFGVLHVCVTLECIGPDFQNRGRNDNLLQCVTPSKGITAYFGQGAWQCDCLQLGTTSKGMIPNRDQPFGKNHACQLFGLGKGVRSDLSHGVALHTDHDLGRAVVKGDDDRGVVVQKRVGHTLRVGIEFLESPNDVCILALRVPSRLPAVGLLIVLGVNLAAKSTPADRGNRRGDHDLLKTPANVKCIFADRGQSVGERDAFKRFTVIKRASLNHLQGAWQGDRFQLGALEEGMLTNSLHATLHGYGLQLLTPCKSLLADLFDRARQCHVCKLGVVLKGALSDRGNRIAVQTREYRFRNALVSADHGCGLVIIELIGDAVDRHHRYRLDRLRIVGFDPARAVAQVVGIVDRHRVCFIGDQILVRKSVELRFGRQDITAQRKLHAQQLADRVGIGHGNAKGDRVLGHVQVGQRDHRHSLCYGGHVQYFHDRLRAETVARIIDVGHAHRIAVSGEQTVKRANVKAFRHDRCIVAMQQLNFGNVPHVVRVVFDPLKGKSGLRVVRKGQLRRGNDLCLRAEFQHHGFGLFVVDIGCDQLVVGVGVEPINARGIGGNVLHLLLALQEHEARHGLVCKGLIPEQAEGNARVCDLNRVKREDLLRVERLFGQHVVAVARSVQRVIRGHDGVLIQRVGLQSLKEDSGFLAECNVLRGDQLLTVIEHGLHLALTQRDQTLHVADRHLEGQSVKADQLVDDRGHGLMFGINANAHRAVALHANVLDHGTVNVLDRVDGVLDHARRIADVDLQDQIFHIRAVLKHIGGILVSVEREGQDLEIVGVVDVDRDVDVLVRVGVIHLGRRSLHRQRILDGLFDVTASTLAAIERILLIHVVSVMLIGQEVPLARHQHGVQGKIVHRRR